MNIETIQDAYYILTAVSSAVILLLGFLLQRLHLPSNNEFLNFKIVRRYLSVSYFILGGSGLVTCVTSPVITTSLLLSLVTVSVASFQSLLFTAVHMLLMQPNSATKENVRKHLAGLAAANGLVFAAYYLDVIPTVILATVVLLLYLVLQAFYIMKFNKVCRMQHKFVGVYYDNVQDARYKTIIVSFYASFSIGIISLAASVVGLWLYVIFIVLYTLYYTHLVILLYNKLSPSVTVSQPVHTGTKANVENIGHTASAANNQESQATTESADIIDEEVFKENLKRWVADKGFAQYDLSVDEVAQILGTNRNFLRKYFRDNVHTDFRTWRSELRIEEAKKLLIEHPEYSISQIGEMVGFNHRSNFFTQFSKITGLTPTDWRKEQGINTD